MENLLGIEGILKGLALFGFCIIFCIFPDICMGLIRIGTILVDIIERKLKKID